MKIRLYIVTYNHPTFLNRGLKSLFESNYPSACDITKNEFEVFIINNHTNFALEKEYEDRVTVMHNDLRPDWSTGHLTRNWNQALVNGFENLDDPACDLVIHAQDDLDWAPGWADFLVGHHKKYDFINIGTGDAVCSYTPEAVRKIGLWDERFCAIGYHVADYHLRAVKFHGQRSSINDLGHGRVWNALPGNVGTHATHEGGNENVVYAPKHDTGRKDQHDTSSLWHPYNENIFTHKWGDDGRVNYIGGWKFSSISQIPELTNPQYVSYPYFESNFTKNGHPCYKLPCRSRLDKS